MPSLTKNEVKVYRLGTWNVRSARSKEEELVWEIKRCDLDILGLSETKGRGNDMKVMGSVSYVCTGVMEGRTRGGVCRHCGGGAMGRLHQKLEMHK